MRALLILPALLALSGAALGSSTPDVPPPHAGPLIARLTAPRVAARRWPGGPLRNTLRRTQHTGEDTGLMVLGHMTAPDGSSWWQVRLPTRPNWANGWVPARAVRTRPAPFRIVIDRSARTLTLREVGTNRVRVRTRVVVGAPRTPTPLGRFAVWERYATATDNAMRPWVLTLTAHSSVLSRFQGGEARIAMHGMHDYLAATPGTAVSNGCIRVPGRALTLLARWAPPGTPVTVVA